VRLCIVLTALKVLLAAGGLALSEPFRFAQVATLYPYYFLEMAVYLGSAALLILFGSRDRRAVNLGIVFMMSASAFADGLIPALKNSPSSLRLSADILLSIRLFSLVPVFLWMFAQDFPRTIAEERVGLLRFARNLSLVVGVSLCVANVAFGPARDFWGLGLSPRWLRMFAYGGGAVYWSAVYSLVLAVLPVIIWRSRSAPKDERRRVSVFGWGLALGVGPALFLAFLEAAIPPIGRYLSVPSHRVWQLAFGYTFLALTPLAATYAVFVYRVLDVRLIVRKAIQYALARYTVLIGVFLPSVGLLVFLYQHRDETLVSLFRGSLPVILLLTVAAGVLTYRYRQSIFTGIDRRFFREQYDANRILSALIEKTRTASSIRDLIDLLGYELDRAIHPTAVAVCLLDVQRAVLRSLDGQCRPLSQTSTLAAILETNARPINVGPVDARSDFAKLDADGQSWIADHGFSVLVPFLGADGRLLGLIALGEKKSELPYSMEDRNLLAAVAVSSAFAIDRRMAHETPSLSSSASIQTDELSLDRGRYCPGCHQIEPWGTAVCPSCGKETIEASVPCVLAGKFRLEKRVGAGAMGVVYRAVDLTLRRHVAIKTLPRISTAAAVWLRREARAIAAVTHPNLAMILGTETWRGTPVLVFEFLDGGTLADRLIQDALTARQAIDLGIAVAAALDRIHNVGMLHRDVKPSNIGFTGDQVPKLMDFGLARIFSWPEWEQHTEPYRHTEASARTLTSPFSTQSGVAGTPLYLTPEAVKGKEPSPQNDLWALAMTLVESLAGRHPLAHCTGQELFRTLSECRLPPIEVFLSNCPHELSAFLSTALSAQPSRRPRSAQEFIDRLTDLRAVLRKNSPPESGGVARSAGVVPGAPQ
jgi:hypothetical protein